MPKPKSIKWERRIFWIAAIVIAAFLIADNIGTFWNIFKVIIGFGFMILVHEFGHFIVAKLSDIKVEAFSIGFPPTLLGIKRTERGYHISILPKADEQSQTISSAASFDLGKKSKPGETEYRIGLIPFGGFVKMLGQEDIGQVKSTDDPRSYSNKPVGIRFCVLAAGVTLNIISAIILFMAVFLIGIDAPPPIVGGVEPGYPAAKTDLQPGDEIIEINGRSRYLDFGDLMLSAALADWAEEVPVKVKRRDGSVEEIYLTSEKKAGDTMGRFGIIMPMSLEIGLVSDVNALMATTGLKPGDKIISVNGKDVEHYWQLRQIVNNSFASSVSMLAQRQTGKNEQPKLIDVEIPLAWSVQSGTGLTHVCSMVPRLKVEAVSQPQRGLVQKLSLNVKKMLAKANLGPEPEEYKVPLKPNDIIIAAADVDYPTYDELTEITNAHEANDLPLTVLRADKSGELKSVDIIVKPKRVSNRVVIGFFPVLDAASPVVAATIEVEGEQLDLPRGSTITKVNDTAVSDFYAMAQQISDLAGEKIVIEYVTADSSKGKAAITIDENLRQLNVSPMFAVSVPFDQMQRIYKADGPGQAVAMGFTKTTRLILSTYATLRSLVSGQVGTDTLMGPVGILHTSYYIVSQEPLIKYVYFIAIVSSLIAVFNFLPLPPLDGGLAVFLLVEKIKGSPVSTKIQTTIAGAGWILIGALFIFLTFNDIARMIFGSF